MDDSTGEPDGIEDGTYDALVFDVADLDGGGVTVELTIVTGALKGEALSIAAPNWPGDGLDLLGIPATITVEGGQPSVRFEP